MERISRAIRRCSVYTRKSSEEGLEQDFNSLHAQREACEAFIRSQAGEGWRLIPTAYDDGGFSGGNMERPALKRLMADIRDGKISAAYGKEKLEYSPELITLLLRRPSCRSLRSADIYFSAIS